MKSFRNKKIAFLHGRLGPHIMHGRLAKSVNGEFQKIDHYKVWNDGFYNRLYIIYAWIYNALAFKKPSQYDIFLVSGPHVSPIIMKFFRLSKKQKVIVHLGDETMYFLFDKWYGKVMQKVLPFLLNNYDALLCEGQMAADLAKLNGIKTKTYTTYLGVPNERHSVLLKLNPKLENNIFITISTGPNGWREYYKGLDLMIDAFAIAFESSADIKFIIVGEWDIDVQNKLTNNLKPECRKAIEFVGHTKEIDRYLSEATFYYHTARGDAFPTVVLEGMAAGLIPIVSEWTGSKEVVKDVDQNLILKIDKSIIADKLIDLTSLPINERILLSNKAREKSKQFTESWALDHYQKTFDQIINDYSL